MSRGYKTYADFEREEIRSGMRAGWSCDELEMPNPEQELDFDMDPFEAALQRAESEEVDDD